MESRLLSSRKLVIKGRACGQADLPFLLSLARQVLDSGFLLGPGKSSLGHAQELSEVSQPESADDRI